MGFLFKKEYRLTLILIVVFGLFLYTVDQTSEQIVSHYANVTFKYEERAFLKLVYLVLLFVTISSLAKLSNNEESSAQSKGKAFGSYVYLSIFSFFIGWIIHLYFVIKTLKAGESFMQLEDQFWIYFSADILFVLGFVISSLLILRPAIHAKD